jgi:exopolysaccharide biosynthesis polyprenyl glycosylphosphotransferase
LIVRETVQHGVVVHLRQLNVPKIQGVGDREDSEISARVGMTDSPNPMEQISKPAEVAKAARNPGSPEGDEVLLLPSDGFMFREELNPFLEEDSFRAMIALARKRSERSRQACALVLVSVGEDLTSQKREQLLERIAIAFAALTRETDTTGWYETNFVVGAIFTDIIVVEKHAVIGAILSRVNDTLQDSLTLEQFDRVSISIHSYPEDWHHEVSRRPSNPTLYPDLESRDESRKISIAVKRMMDIVGSTMALVFSSPLFFAIALAIKLSSNGPVFFRQERVGQHGKSFVMFKFRSMNVNNDTSVHKQWFQNFHSGRAERHGTDDKGSGIYKLANDPRVTKLGRFLRRTSLDELPQFINVLVGNMSLVGPRPPIPYEVDAYQAWQRGRILQAKPGMTGLWQVTGRSRVCFDEMVRLDLRYARTWSIWLDTKILLKTPAAVFFGEGAY